MSQVITIGLDIAKNVFQAHGADERGAMVFSRKLTRGKLLDFSPVSQHAWLRSKRAAARIIGRASCRRWDTRFG